MAEPTPGRFPAPNPFTYWGIVYSGLAVLNGVGSRLEVIGAENFPRRGPVLVAANHINWFDPPLIMAASPRRVVYLTKEELAAGMAGRMLGAATGWLTIRRGTADRAALRGARDVLSSGLPLGIHPEGTRSLSGQLQRAHPGAALLALWTGAPVLPTGVWGTYGFRLPGHLFARRRFTVRFGQPFTLRDEDFAAPARDRLNAATDLIMRRIAELLPPDHRGVYADAAGSAAERPG